MTVGLAGFICGSYVLSLNVAPYCFRNFRVSRCAAHASLTLGFGNFRMLDCPFCVIFTISCLSVNLQSYCDLKFPNDVDVLYSMGLPVIVSVAFVNTSHRKLKFCLPNFKIILLREMI